MGARLFSALAALLLAGCTVIPPKYAAVTWHARCVGGPVTRLIVFHDTPTPVLSCIANAPAGDAATYTALLLVGAPVIACAVPGARPDEAHIYAAMSAGLAQMQTAFALMTPEQVIEHEIDHVYSSIHPLLLPWLDRCPT